MLFEQLPDNLKEVKAASSRKRPASGACDSNTSIFLSTYATESTSSHPNKPNGSQGTLSKKAGKAPAVPITQGIPVEDLPQPELGGSFSSSFQFSPLDLSIPSPDSVTAAALHEPSPMDLQHQAFGGSNPINELDAVMFPSDDPLAYPNQPQVDFGPHHSGISNVSPGDISRHDPSQYYMPDFYEGIEGQLMGPLPPYLLQSQGQPGFNFPVEMYSDPMLQQLHSIENPASQPQAQFHSGQSRSVRRRGQQSRDMEELLANASWHGSFPHREMD